MMNIHPSYRLFVVNMAIVSSEGGVYEFSFNTKTSLDAAKKFFESLTGFRALSMIDC